ncbi:MAG TPA: S41 family peptidase [Candidatus Polarisedimenticolaceae bacterium]|nr:S41 family peptidase [Candidatus Polarisedimenticolaceae bacterium]
MSHPPRRFPFLAIVVLSVGALLGGLLGGGVKADPQHPEEELFGFGKVLSLVEDQYVGQADSRDLVEHAIDGMLRTLDPHSNYLDPDSFSEMRDEQRGRFYGLGIQIAKRGPDKPLTVIAPIDGTPAQRAGMLSGDMIVKIEGQATLDMTVQQAVRLLKGDKGTRVTITIQRPGVEQAFDVSIERDEIPIDSIRVAFMLQPGVGFVRISNFTSTTADELDRAIEKLKSQGLERLILDLRGNPGGLLEQAVQVSERFLPEGKLVVYTRGRIAGSNQDFLAKGREQWLSTPLVVLVDRSSASASEIVSGAIQDQDRGLVVGETTFGKGLVQRVIPLRNGGALAVTTAKYYTPSGRLIQRDYSDLEAYYLTRDDADPDAPGAEAAPNGSPEKPAEKPAEEHEIRHTASGRKVYGGGGIRPDYVVPSPEMPQLLFRMIRENVLFDFAVLYTNGHPTLERGFHVEEPMLEQFRQFLQERKFELEPKEFGENKEMIALRLRAQIARVKWDAIEESRVLFEADPQVQKALGVFEEAAELERRGLRASGGRPEPIRPPASSL